MSCYAHGEADRKKSEHMKIIRGHAAEAAGLVLSRLSDPAMVTGVHLPFKSVVSVKIHGSPSSVRFGHGSHEELLVVPVFGSGGSSEEGLLLCLSYSFSRKWGSGSDISSRKTVPTVPVLPSVPSKQFGQFRVPDPAWFLHHPEDHL